MENYKALFPRLQSKKEKITHYPTNQNLDSGARLQNGKMLGTHSAQTESSLLDSKWPFIFPFKWCMTLQWHIEILKFKINSFFKASKSAIFIKEETQNWWYFTLKKTFFIIKRVQICI